MFLVPTRHTAKGWEEGNKYKIRVGNRVGRSENLDEIRK